MQPLIDLINRLMMCIACMLSKAKIFTLSLFLFHRSSFLWNICANVITHLALLLLSIAEIFTNSASNLHKSIYVFYCFTLQIKDICMKIQLQRVLFCTPEWFY